jgi:hydroxymethylbilane synthase
LRSTSSAQLIAENAYRPLIVALLHGGNSAKDGQAKALEAFVTALRIGTRGSPLALVQAGLVRARLAASHGMNLADIDVRIIKTSGDRIQDRNLADIGGKGLFTKELEDALHSGEIDLAVHSMKDVATRLPDGLTIAAILNREDPRDAFISLKYASIAAMPAGAVIGTSSLRRQAQLLAARPDLKVVAFRGNVETRLAKLADGVADATFLAVAGLNRLGMASRMTQALPPEVMLPAVAQGAVGIEIRASDQRVAALVAPLDHPDTHDAVRCERAFLLRLDGSCRTPIAGHASIDKAGQLTFTGEVLSPDGADRRSIMRRGPRTSAEAIGDEAGLALLATPSSSKQDA